MNDNLPKTFTREEVAQIFKVDIVTIDRWIKSGKIQSIKIGNMRRITEEEVERLLQK